MQVFLGAMRPKGQEQNTKTLLDARYVDQFVMLLHLLQRTIGDVIPPNRFSLAADTPHYLLVAETILLDHLRDECRFFWRIPFFDSRYMTESEIAPDIFAIVGQQIRNLLEQFRFNFSSAEKFTPFRVNWVSGGSACEIQQRCKAAIALDDYEAPFPIEFFANDKQRFLDEKTTFQERLGEFFKFPITHRIKKRILIEFLRDFLGAKPWILRIETQFIEFSVS